MISNTPDSSAILNLCHFILSILTQHPISSHTIYACARHASPVLTSFCSSNLPSPFPYQGLCTCYSIHLECLPSLIPCVHDWFICSEVSIKCHFFFLSCLNQRSASHSLLHYTVLLSLQHSSLSEIILFFVDLFRV